MSLEDLLEQGFFRGPTSGGAFSLQDKAILALSLSRCLLHLFQSGWIERPWDAESIQFLYRSTPAEILDIHHPYVRYHLSPRGEDYTDPKPAAYRDTMLCFARLLLEIELGSKIAINIPGDIKEQLFDILDNLDGPQGHYHHAVKGCLKFADSLAARENRAAKQAKSSRKNQDSRTRTALYRDVIEHLERNVSCFPNHKRYFVQRNLQIGDRSIRSEPPEADPRAGPQVGAPGIYRETYSRPEQSRDSHSLVPGQRLNLAMEPPEVDPEMEARRFRSTLPLDERPTHTTEIPTAQTTLPSHNRPLRRSEFEVAIVCALRLEYDAVAHIFDEFWDEEDDPYGKAPGDKNTYTTGRIGKFNVVLVLLPGMGKVNAASTTANFRVSYTGVQLALLVGICGGVPKYDDGVSKEILLGDVVISTDIIQYDFGRLLSGGFKRKNTRQDALGRPNTDITSFIGTLRTEIHLKRLRRKTMQYLATIQGNNSRSRYADPGTDEDKLFEPSYIHKHASNSAFDCHVCDECTHESDPVCDGASVALCSVLRCDESQLVLRRRLELDGAGVPRNCSSVYEDWVCERARPILHFGPIASGDTVMKSGKDRDRHAERDGVIAFEMEGAGVWENLSCIVIKGVCDYADSHKNKKWQNFAAATAACATKALLEKYPKQTNEF
ncbi:hypothetical protein TWF481_006097 [Arthrobotrys musiformis]|uniref:Nucleoside phosphorylase domain-containing protein n=1 Tax=Arthrobotrys musiformis TaxID=47236 RepID=A0AAV9WH33_9PEZI